MQTWPLSLPFALNLAPAPLLSAGGIVQISIDFLAPLDDETTEMADGALNAFWALAGSGGLLGDALKPGQSTTGHIDPPRAHQSRLSWHIGDVRVDERAWVNLALLLQTLHVDVPLLRVYVTGSGAGTSSAVLQDPSAPIPWVPAHPKPAFPIVVDPDAEADVVEFTVEFDADTTELREGIEAELWAWVAAVIAGGFCVLPLVDRPAAEVDPPAWSADTLTWQLSQTVFDPAALDSFANLCMTLHATTCPIRQVTMI